MNKLLTLIDGHKTQIGIALGFATTVVSQLTNTPDWITTSCAVVSASIAVVGRYHAGKKIKEAFAKGQQIAQNEKGLIKSIMNK